MPGRAGGVDGGQRVEGETRGRVKKDAVGGGEREANVASNSRDQFITAHVEGWRRRWDGRRMGG